MSKLFSLVLAALLLSRGIDAFGNDAAPVPKRPSREEVAAKAGEILDSGLYQKSLPESGPESKSRRSRIAYSSEDGAAGAGILKIAAWTVFGLCLLLLAGAVVVSIRARAGALTVPGPASGGNDAVRTGPSPSPAAAAQAELLASGTDYLQAVRTLFMDAARMVEERSRVVLARTRTNGEYLSEFAPGDPLGATMRRLASMVERCLYGGAPCAEEDWLAARAAWEGLKVQGSCDHRNEPA